MKPCLHLPLWVYQPTTYACAWLYTHNIEDNAERVYTNQKGGREEGETGVLHATISKGWRQYKDVVLAPEILSNNFLCCTQHLLCLQYNHWFCCTVHVLQTFILLPTSSNSHAAFSTISFSHHTWLRGPILLYIDHTTKFNMVFLHDQTSEHDMNTGMTPFGVIKTWPVLSWLFKWCYGNINESLSFIFHSPLYLTLPPSPSPFLSPSFFLCTHLLSRAPTTRAAR